MNNKITVTDLFKKHFGDVVQVDMKHENIEDFFKDLNTICLNEGKKIVYTFQTSICGSCGKEFSLTGEEIYFAESTDGTKQKAPLCPACVNECFQEQPQ